MACRTALLCLGYVGDSPHSLLAFNLGSPTAGNERVAAMVMWRLTSAFEGSVVADVALRLLSVPAHAAELEWVWSGMGLANMPLRNRLDTDRLTDMTKVVLQMRAALAKEAAPRQTVSPGSRMDDSCQNAGGMVDPDDDDEDEWSPPPAVDNESDADSGAVADLASDARSMQQELDEES